MGLDNILLIAVAEARTAVAAAADKPVLDRFRAALSITHHHWLLRNDDQYFRAAVAAVLVETKDPDEKAAISDEIATIRILDAMFTGVPVDLGAIDVSPERLSKQFGLLNIYRTEFLNK